ncbi:Hypothetical protein CAP_1088 [Chondromyces apiculatus DSM 436]|uniref:Uncharacterized protein n=1 Tax=Chondromyces apiculatus DSM 436 TaxID=1192034 RepID=A0A017STA6_9BACT|nr:Hypothetical protein CAP_1088 [Chondromyces apiculatus DSM 436]
MVEALLGLVVDEDDVADGIVGVAQILQDHAVRDAHRLEAGEAEGERVVGVLGEHVVAVGDALTLGLGTVIDVDDEGGPSGGSAQPDVDGFEQAGFVVRRPGLALVGLGDADGPVEGVVSDRAGEGLRLQGGSRRRSPVELVLVVNCQGAGAAKRVALEVEAGAGDEPGAVVLLVDLAAQVEGRRIGDAIAVDGALGEHLRVGALLHPQLDRSPEHVVRGPEGMAAAVPSTKRISEHIREHPPGAGVDAVLVDLAAGHVEGVDHALLAAGVFDDARVAFEVERSRGEELDVFFQFGDAHHGAPERVDLHHGGRVVVSCGQIGGALVGEAGGGGGAGLAGSVPEVAVFEHGVVGVPGGLRPGREPDARVGAVGEVGAHEPAQGVVVEDRGHAPVHERLVVLVLGRAAEVGLVLLDGVALVVDDGAAGADPALERDGHLQDAAVEHGVAVGVEDRGEAGLGLDLAHQLAAGAVGVGVALLPAGVRVAVGLAGAGVDDAGLAGVQVAEEVDLQGGGGVVEGVAVLAPRLAHHRGGDHHAQRVEAHGGAVAVGIGDLHGGHHPVVVGDDHLVAERVLGARDQQVVRVVVDGGGGAPGVEERGGEEEVRVVEELAPGGDPPPGCGRELDVPAFAQERRGDARLAVVEGVVDQALGEGELVALVRERVQVDFAQVEGRRQGGAVLVAHAHVLEEAAYGGRGFRGFRGFRGGRPVLVGSRGCHVRLGNGRVDLLEGVDACSGRGEAVELVGARGGGDAQAVALGGRREVDDLHLGQGHVQRALGCLRRHHTLALAPRVGHRDALAHDAVLIDLEREGVRHARVQVAPGAVTLVVERDRFPRRDQEDGRRLALRRLLPAHGVAALHHRVGRVLLRRAIERVDLLAQGLTAQGPAGLAHLVGGQVRQVLRQDRVRQAGLGVVRPVREVFLLVLPTDRGAPAPRPRMQPRLRQHRGLG